MTKQNRRPLVIGALIATLALMFGGFTAANASQSTYPWDSADIENQSLLSVDLGPNSVGSSEVAPDSVGTGDVKANTLMLADINDNTEAALRGGAYDYEFTANVANIGGPFLDNATEAGTFTLSAGSYKITTSTLFRSNATTSGRADLQTAVRADDGTVWGQDLGTAFTGDSPVQANREVSSHVTEVVTVPADTTVTVYVFGYDNEGQGSPDARLFDASVDVVVEETTVLN